MNNKLYKYLIFCCFICVQGCAISTDKTIEKDPAEQQSSLENYNRAMFTFNTKVDKYLIKPVAKGYRAVTNEFVRNKVSNFFNNIEEPVSAVNHVLQGEIKDSGYNVGRFVINTTLGIVGLFDVASSMGMDRHKTGFDETLATWCVPDGPFIVLPIMGPSTPRATIGFVADGYSSPAFWIAEGSGDSDKWAYYYGATGLKYVNLMAENLNILEGLEQNSVDYYETMKSTYLQNRTKLPRCGKNDTSYPEYDFDMDMEDEFE